MATTKQSSGGLFTKQYTPMKTAVILPNGDKQHGCGCVTYWCAQVYTHGQLLGPIMPGTVLYRKVCGSHKGYANRLCLVAP